MFDADKLLGRVIDSGAAGGLLGGALGAGAVGMLGSKKGRTMAKSALKLGGIAVVGALAYRAYSRYSENRQPGQAVPQPGPAPAELTPPPAGSAFLPDAANRDSVQSTGVTLIRSMIAAAKADGEIDAIEGQRLFARMDRVGLDGEERAFLLQELARPVDLDAIVASASTPELAAEVYAASLMAIDVSNQAESAYLQLLASRLKLDDSLVAELHRSVDETSAETAS